MSNLVWILQYILLDEGCDINFDGTLLFDPYMNLTTEWVTPLMMASWYCNEQMIKHLLSFDDLGKQF